MPPGVVAPRAGSPADVGGARPRLSEVLALWAVVAVAVAGTAGLVLAHAGDLTSTTALCTTAGVVAVTAVVGLRLAPHGLRLDVAAVAVAVLAGAAALLLFLPGAPYALADKDPGVYVVHSFAIARDGATSIEDPLRAADPDLPVFDYTSGARFPGLRHDPDDDTLITPQFFHLWPVLQSFAVDAAGERGAFTLTPVLAALSVVVLGLAARAALDGREGDVAGLAVTALVATNMVQVWQAKYPSSEILAQLLVSGGLLAAAVAVRTRWGPAAAIAGFLATASFLARPDGLLVLVLAAVALGALVVVRAPARPVGWFAAGLLVPLPYALYNAYVRAEEYSLGNGLPELPVVLAVLGGIAVTAALLRGIRWAAARRRARREDDDRAPDGHPVAPTVVRALLTVASGAVFAGLWFRGELLGEDLIDYGDRTIRSLDELNLRRLAWFLTVPGIVAAWAGLVALVWRRPLLVRLAVVVAPGLLVAPLYLWEARNSPQLMWWSRRYVPAVIPTFLLLAGTLVAFALTGRRWWARIGGLALFGYLVVAQLGQSLPLRRFEEMEGSWEVLERLDAIPEGEAVFLWPEGPGGHVPGASLGGSLWFLHDRPGTVLPAEDTEQSVVDAHQRAFPDREVYVVTSHGTDLPAGLDPEAFELVAELVGELRSLERPLEEVPTEVLTLPYDLRVYRYLG